MPLTISYGSHPSQTIDLQTDDHRAPLLVLLHGGFWRAPYGAEEFERIIPGLVKAGFTVANVEYRRVGESGGGWPGTGADVLAAIDFLRWEGDAPRPMFVVGFSAGGHLALWAARHRPELRAVAALAPISDLHEGAALGLGKGAVRELLGGLPREYSESFARANPIECPRVGVEEIVIHGAEDDLVPVAMSRRYAAQVGAQLVEVAGEGHGAHLDPGSECHAQLMGWLRDRAGRSRQPLAGTVATGGRAE